MSNLKDNNYIHKKTNLGVNVKIPFTVIDEEATVVLGFGVRVDDLLQGGDKRPHLLQSVKRRQPRLLAVTHLIQGQNGSGVLHQTVVVLYSRKQLDFKGLDA